MPLFTSSKEKRLWMYVLLVLAAIFSTLLFSKPIQKFVVNQDIQAVFFLIAMVLIGIAIVFHGLKVKASNIELTIWFGLLAILVLLLFRLGASERSHLIEYSVLAIFTHKALKERFTQKRKWFFTAFLSFCIVLSIGVFDELLQLFLPNRVFDPVDILFNGLAAFFSIAFSIVLELLHKKFRKTRID